jgi:hypothetical protein
MLSWPCVDTVAQPETTHTDCPFSNLSGTEHVCRYILPDWCSKAQEKVHTNGFKIKFNVAQLKYSCNNEVSVSALLRQCKKVLFLCLIPFCC